jgi:hypothetical protein
LRIRIWTFKLQEKPLTLKREHPELFSLLDPEPGSRTPLNPDPIQSRIRSTAFYGFGSWITKIIFSFIMLKKQPVKLKSKVSGWIVSLGP